MEDRLAGVHGVRHTRRQPGRDQRDDAVRLREIWRWRPVVIAVSRERAKEFAIAHVETLGLKGFRYECVGVSFDPNWYGAIVKVAIDLFFFTSRRAPGSLCGEARYRREIVVPHSYQRQER